MAMTTIQVRVDTKLKRDITKLCDKLGANLSEMVTAFLVQSVRMQGLPFRPHLCQKSCQCTKWSDSGNI